MKKSLSITYVIMICFFNLAITSCKKSDAVTEQTVSGARSYYVSVSTGSVSNSGTSINAPFRSVNSATTAAVPGDTVFLMNGTFTSPITLTKSGAPNKYITYKALPGHNPKITVTAAGGNWDAVSITGKYIVFDGIELAGNNAQLNLADARAAYDSWVASGVNNSIHAKFNTNAISANNTHHVIVRNCNIHDYPGAGVGAGNSDYITIENNTIYNNSWYTMYATSGISLIYPVNSDAPDVNKYKLIIRNNIVYGNKTQVPWTEIKKLSDGNGIIIDINRATPSTTAYNSRTLVENNVSFNNGGSGIHAFKADHVDIVNNSTYNNGTIVGYEEIFANNASDVKIINNIMYARTSGKWTSKPATGAVVTYANNIYFNSVAVSGITGTNTNANPLYKLLPTITNGVVVGNFDLSLNAGSPAINAGTLTKYALTDILGVARPKGGAVDCGAYEVQ